MRNGLCVYYISVKILLREEKGGIWERGERWRKKWRSEEEEMEERERKRQGGTEGWRREEGVEEAISCNSKCKGRWVLASSTAERMTRGEWIQAFSRVRENSFLSFPTLLHPHTWRLGETSAPQTEIAEFWAQSPVTWGSWTAPEAERPLWTRALCCQDYFQALELASVSWASEEPGRLTPGTLTWRALVSVPLPPTHSHTRGGNTSRVLRWLMMASRQQLPFQEFYEPLL